MEDKTPTTTELAFVTLLDEWLVAFCDTTKLDDTATDLDNELDLFPLFPRELDTVATDELSSVA